jgi:hypothetical protein
LKLSRVAQVSKSNPIWRKPIDRNADDESGIVKSTHSTNPSAAGIAGMRNSCDEIGGSRVPRTKVN